MKRTARIMIMVMFGVLLSIPLIASAYSNSEKCPDPRNPAQHAVLDVDSCKFIGNGKHITRGTCRYCGQKVAVTEYCCGHTWRLNRSATYLSKGRMVGNCPECNGVDYYYFPWRYGDEDSISYDVYDHSTLYKTSKSIKVVLEHPAKGAVVKVKIGNKTYSKKINNNSTTVKMKIKKPAYGKPIDIKVYYGKLLIGTDRFCDRPDSVLYAKKIKKGMTKKQVTYTLNWGPAYYKSSFSSGWSRWGYLNGSYIYFKNGKVKRWHKVSR